MSATQELIAAEVGKLSLGEKKASIAESHTSSSSSSSSASSSIKHQCPCFCNRNISCCNHVFAACQLPLQLCLIHQWGGFYVAPPCYYNHSLPIQKCCTSKISCCQIALSCKCSAKASEKKYKTAKVEESPRDKKEEGKGCNCCKEEKCECCKTGKECDDTASEKSEKSDAGSGDEGGEKDDERGGGHSVAQLIHRFSMEV